MTEIRTLHSFEPTEPDTIHDTEPDFYGEKVVTADSAGRICVYSVQDGVHELEATLQRHTQAAIRATWSPPDCGVMIASLSLDCSLVVWAGAPTWAPVFEKRLPAAPTDAAWFPAAPALLAVACADGNVYAFEAAGGAFRELPSFRAQTRAALSLSFVRRGLLAVGGADATVALFALTPDGAQRTCDPVPLAAWATSVAANTLDDAPAVAVGLADGGVLVFAVEGDALGATLGAAPTTLPFGGAAVTCVSWNVLGTTLCVSGDGRVEFFRPGAREPRVE